MEDQRHILGLDIGTSSVGWAVLSADEDGKPTGIVDAGVRIFDAGVEGVIESGRDESRAVKRREARLRRRMLHRRAQRLRRLVGLLQGAGLLPSGSLANAEDRVAFFNELDDQIFSQSVRKAHPHVLPYLLRAQALDRKLSPHELGRAIYHLAHRRGFWSNRKAAKRRDDDEGQVKESIGKLAQAMEDTSARTLGEYFSRLDPVHERIRARWTGRQMFIDEFDAIWNAQASHHPSILTPEFRKLVYKAVFYQRPLRWDRSTIGKCELEPRRRRAPLAILPAQRFRLLQKVNDLRVGGFDPETGEVPLRDDLTAAQATKLTDALETNGDLTFAKVRRLLELSKWVKFNLEEGGEKKIIGNRTNAKLREIFGTTWDEFAADEKDRIVEDVRSVQKPETQYRRGIKWGLVEESDAAREFGELALEPDYCNLSRRAIEKVLPHMEEGKSFATVRKEIYGARPPPKPFDELPRLAAAPIPPFRNPAISRSLTELRKVANAIVGKYGKPWRIHIELARDLKRRREERKTIWKRNLDARQKREGAAQQLLADHRIENPSGEDIEKFLLAVECGWTCPYTGKNISGKALFGSAPQFDVEHIIPFSRCLDNSFINKTLCDAEENRNRKRNRTPWEAYASDPERWQKIVSRVKAFNGDASLAKFERFQIKDMDDFDEFASRQLNDTRYASRLAIEYLGLLFGTGAQGVDADHTRRILAGRGAVTKYVRDEFGLNRLLGDGGAKNRGDHRHHAVDAVAIALTDARTIKALSDAASRAAAERRRKFGRLEPPWLTFDRDVGAAVDRIVVSHRVTRKVNGPLHEETIYSKPQKDDRGRPCVHVRKPLAKMTKGDVEDIVDPVIRKVVAEKLNGREPKTAFASPADHPVLPSGVAVHSARIRKCEADMCVGKGARSRNVVSGSNHHVEVFEYSGPRGAKRWGGAVVSRFEAMDRLRKSEPIVNRNHGDGKKFVFTLCSGELVEMNEPEAGGRGIFVVRSVDNLASGAIKVKYVGVRAALTHDLLDGAAWRGLGAPDGLVSTAIEHRPSARWFRQRWFGSIRATGDRIHAVGCHCRSRGGSPGCMFAGDLREP